MHHCHEPKESCNFYKDLSSIYQKDVSNQRLNQSHHDARSWYHRTAVSIECLQAPSLRGSKEACLQTRKKKDKKPLMRLV